jgi:hypothetical protein
MHNEHYVSDPASPTLTLANPTAGAPIGVSPTPNIVTFGPYLPMAMANQWSLDVARPLWRGAGLDVQYLGSRTIHLDRSIECALGRASRPVAFFRRTKTALGMFLHFASRSSKDNSPICQFAGSLYRVAV